MIDRIEKLKENIYSLERAINVREHDIFRREIQNILEECSALEIEFYSKDEDEIEVESVESVEEAVIEHVEEPVEDQEVSYDVLNTIEFLYKPLDRVDIYDGNYLEYFAEERTNQLMTSRAINNHNEFWKQHVTISGNVYGSVPVELIHEESKETLERFGWKLIDVDVLDFRCKYEDKEDILKYCERAFDKYILVNEVTTDSYLILNYNV